MNEFKEIHGYKIYKSQEFQGVQRLQSCQRMA